jgi:hypothetical protein
MVPVPTACEISNPPLAPLIVSVNDMAVAGGALGNTATGMTTLVAPAGIVPTPDVAT